MKRLLLATALLIVSSGAVAQERHEHSGGSDAAGRNSYANPSAVIATELAFARLAQDKGQWTAFATYAAPDAVMFAPQMVYAQAWLKGRANPPEALKWQPQEVWSSCDGSLMVSHGAWQGKGEAGWFTTIWQRQKNGDYKWILDHGESLKDAPAVPDMIAGHLADCPERKPRGGASGKDRPADKPAKPKALPPLDPAHRAGKSDDGTLAWDVAIQPGGARKLLVTWKKDGRDSTVLEEQAGTLHRD